MRTRLDPLRVGASRRSTDTGGAIRFGDAPGAPCCAADELRCGCGSLLARLVGDAVELKCRRCKRVFCIPVERTA